MLFSIQLLIILICLFYGARKGGIALGLLGGIGLVILVFVFHLQPGKPPVDVMLVIIAVVAASATLQASGGLDVMLQIAEKLLRRNPKYVSIVAPFVTCTLTILCGTGHVVYTILPIIYDVAIKNNIRPERPMAASSIGAQMGIIASPVSVAVVSLVAMLGNVTFDGKHLEFLDLLSITIPSTLLGILAIGIFSWFRGKDLDKDEAFQKFISVPENRQYVYGDTATLLDKKLPKSNWLAMWIFLAAIAVVDGAGHSDVYAADRGTHYHSDQNQSCVYLKKRSFSFRYDCDCRGIRDRLDGGNHVRRAYVGNSGRAGRNGQRVSVGLCHRSAAGLQVC